MRPVWISLLVTPLFLLPLPAIAQTQAQSSTCPIEFVRFDPDGVSSRIHNVSGKTIVGLTFNVALADATEHWKWLHWQYTDTLPLREFGWNKPIKPDATKKLSWDRSDLDFEHGGGGAFVLTSVLFDDGSSWEEPKSSTTCKALWLNNHKKTFSRPVDLPLRP